MEEKQSYPLWMPEGSVRAILVIGALLTVLVPIFVFVFRKEEIPQGVKEIVLFIAGGTISLIKDYITTRKNGSDHGSTQP